MSVLQNNIESNISYFDRWIILWDGRGIHRNIRKFLFYSSRRAMSSFLKTVPKCLRECIYRREYFWISWVFEAPVCNNIVGVLFGLEPLCEIFKNGFIGYYWRAWKSLISDPTSIWKVLV